ncbi:pentapeptide repeat-containing protein [Actinoplanes sp. NBRC 101535]|uniref:pentapeptide repeat-containing protein n=1 Tax=Actinoplanes sp. NBRC 101535 TaxID=3032196 RepID=UPI0025532EB7|nr:pentapeptide repeat-containing protein [Actinoplanes sp. NBRC 101535]
MSSGDHQRAADYVAVLRDQGGDGARKRAAVRALTALKGVELDLSGATLRDVDFAGGRFGAVNFADARFEGRTSFAGAVFDGEAIFARAVFDGETHFERARFDTLAVFGRARFHGETSFAGAEFRDMAWFGRGEEELWEDDEAWDTVDDIRPQPWDELNEADPRWPVAVVMGEYQGYLEGGDGVRFGAPVSFREAVFAGTAWFGKARFAAAADFRDVRFGGTTHLDSPQVELQGARTAADDVTLPWGWEVRDGVIVAGPEWELRADPEALAEIGDADPGRRQAVVDAVSAFLRTPLRFDLTARRTAEQDRQIEARRRAQRVIAARLRPGRWEGLHLRLSGATLIDVDLTGCAGGVAHFAGAQFHGTTVLDPAGWDRLVLDLGAGRGTATFHDQPSR